MAKGINKEAFYRKKEERYKRKRRLARRSWIRSGKDPALFDWSFYGTHGGKRTVTDIERDELFLRKRATTRQQITDTVIAEQHREQIQNGELIADSAFLPIGKLGRGLRYWNVSASEKDYHNEYGDSIYIEHSLYGYTGRECDSNSYTIHELLTKPHRVEFKHLDDKAWHVRQQIAYTLNDSLDYTQDSLTILEKQTDGLWFIEDDTGTTDMAYYFAVCHVNGHPETHRLPAMDSDLLFIMEKEKVTVKEIEAGTECSKTIKKKLIGIVTSNQSSIVVRRPLLEYCILEQLSRLEKADPTSIGLSIHDIIDLVQVDEKFIRNVVRELHRDTVLTQIRSSNQYYYRLNKSPEVESSLVREREEEE